MQILYYDCFCGISGDMNLGALLDLGVNENYLREELAKLYIQDEYELQIKKDCKNGITGTRVEVVLAGQHAEHVHKKHIHENNHEHVQKHENHVHTHQHQHRNLKDIENIIKNSSLSEKIQQISMDIFHKIAIAEAKVHGKELYEVHFHEVGATDSIIDIVGAAICFAALQVDKVMASTIELGGGWVNCAHGKMPVPAPATVEIVKNLPTKLGIVPFETTTPTGAAILASSVVEFTDKINFSIEKIGYGIGHRDLAIPNVLRIYLGKVN